MMATPTAGTDQHNGSNSFNSITPVYEDPQTHLPDIVIWERIHGIGISLLAIPANLLVIACLCRDPSSAVSGYSTYAVSVAVTDLLVGVILVPINVASTSFYKWSPLFCFLWKLVDFGLTSVSMLLFLAMGYDRYRCVTAPLQYRSQFRANRAVLTSVSVWIVGFLIWIPYLLVKIINVEKFQRACPNLKFDVNVFDILQITVAYFIPMIALVTMNTLLVRTLNRRLQLPRSGSRNRSGTSRYCQENVSTVSGIIELSTTPFKPLKSSPQHENQTSKTTRSRNVSSFKIVLMVVVFLVFWLPFCILYPLDGICDDCLPKLIYEVFTDLTYFQSAVNPLIVIFTSHQIRSKILGTYRRCLHCDFGSKT